MNYSDAAIINPDIPERRVLDRRLTSLAAVKRHRIWMAVGLSLALLVWWKWTPLIHTPTYMLRAHWADRSSLYKGKTNDIPNRQLVTSARSYLAQVNTADSSGNIMTPPALQPLGIHLDSAWFMTHHPDTVDYNPFVSAATGNFVVTWLYVPGCEKVLGKTPGSDTGWFDRMGQACSGVCYVSVRMAPDLRLTSIELHPAR